jgi:transposase
VYESCAWGFNLQRELTAAGIEFIIVHAGDVPGSDKEKKNKTDKVVTQPGMHKEPVACN